MIAVLSWFCLGALAATVASVNLETGGPAEAVLCHSSKPNVTVMSATGPIETADIFPLTSSIQATTDEAERSFTINGAPERELYAWPTGERRPIRARYDADNALFEFPSPGFDFLLARMDGAAHRPAIIVVSPGQEDAHIVELSESFGFVGATWLDGSSALLGSTNQALLLRVSAAGQVETVRALDIGASFSAADASGRGWVLTLGAESAYEVWRLSRAGRPKLYRLPSALVISGPQELKLLGSTPLVLTTNGDILDARHGDRYDAGPLSAADSYFSAFCAVQTANESFAAVAETSAQGNTTIRVISIRPSVEVGR